MEKEKLQFDLILFLLLLLKYINNLWRKFKRTRYLYFLYIILYFCKYMYDTGLTGKKLSASQNSSASHLYADTGALSISCVSTIKHPQFSFYFLVPV